MFVHAMVAIERGAVYNSTLLFLLQLANSTATAAGNSLYCYWKRFLRDKFVAAFVFQETSIEPIASYTKTT